MANTYKSINEAYCDICKDLDSVTPENGVKELINYSFTLEDLNNNIASVVPVSYSYMLGEMLWYALGDETIEFINHFKSTGMNRTSEDRWSNSAYGNIIFSRHGYDQTKQVINELREKPSSRRAIINLNVPDRHRTKRLDEICTIALQYYIRDNKLCCTGIMRSNDAIGCLPYDLAFFTELQKFIAKRVGVEVGTYTHFAVSFHCYERDFKVLKRFAKMDKETVLHTALYIDFEKIMSNRHELESFVNSNYLNVNWPFNFTSKCEGLKIIHQQC